METLSFVLFGAGILAGICNAVAGGGTFFTFPVFLAAGLPPVVANASNAVAVWPGHAFAAVGYRRELRAFSGAISLTLWIALIGGSCGAALLIFIPNTVFLKLVPFLILFATVLFAAGPWLSQALSTAGRGYGDAHASAGTRLAEFLIAVYGGFFGAGMGIMLMAGLHMLGVHDVQQNNALKNLLGAIITSMAVLIFALSGLIDWHLTAIAFAGAVVGGLAGGRIARWLPSSWLRGLVVAIGSLLSIYYFATLYLE
ncbi:MAG: hypothetical protein CME36_05780 [unclassified Hahellaceae]|nr:hypothetical protein [Hahellaceae bacterium]